ncbi:MAG TPA: hypothetical protein VNQ80_15300 [Parapedobacter sp.]|uniref:hypothetical protein n=1 Tax=Parapedobacter sp. TaxID=1958893 RepID=UPI002CDB6718|nr:hypothetical protein [Parapedobacter sp.]HWK58708.1 hypothetical protein [Parapedobacter sp.]
MKRREFKPGVIFREKLGYWSDKGDSTIYELVEHGVGHSVFSGLRHMEIREVFGRRRFVGVVAEKDRFLAVMFVMGEAVVIKARYENLERIPALEKAMKDVKQHLKIK